MISLVIYIWDIPIYIYGLYKPLTDMHIQVSRRWSGFPEIGCSFSTKHPCVLSQLGRPTILRLSGWKPWGKSAWKSWGHHGFGSRFFLEIWPPNHGDLGRSWCSWWKKGCHHRILKKHNVDLEFFRARDGIFDHQTSTFSCAQWLDLLCFLKGCDSEMDPPSSRFWGGEVFGRQAAISGELSLSPAAVSLRASHRFVSECFARSGIEAWLKGMVVAQRFGTKVIKRCMVTINLGRNLLVSFLWAMMIFVNFAGFFLPMFHFHQKWNADSSPTNCVTCCPGNGVWLLSMVPICRRNLMVWWDLNIVTVLG